MRDFKDFKDAKCFFLGLMDSRIKNLEDVVKIRETYGEHGFLTEARANLKEVKMLRKIFNNMKLIGN